MPSPLTETVLVVAIVAASFLVTVVTYLIVLARLGKPLTVDFNGYGVSLRVGAKDLVVPKGEVLNGVIDE